MPNNLPGGRILASMGAYLNVISPLNGALTRLDVEQGDIYDAPRTWRRGSSGSLGCINTRRVAVDWSASFTAWWDILNPPWEILQTSSWGYMDWGCGLQIGIGSLAGQEAYGATVQQFYAAPSCFLRKLQLHQNETGDEGDGIVTCPFEVVSNGPLFLLPNDQTALNTYVASASALGQLTWLSSYNTMQ